MGLRLSGRSCLGLTPIIYKQKVIITITFTVCLPYSLLMLGTEIVINSQIKVLALMEFVFYWKETNNKYMNNFYCNTNVI